MNIKKSMLSKHDSVWLMSNKLVNQFFTCLKVTKLNSGLNKLSLDNHSSVNVDFHLVDCIDFETCVPNKII